MGNPLDLTAEDWKRAENLRRRYADAAAERELLTAEMHSLDFQYFRLTRGWLSKEGSDMLAVRKARYARLTKAQKMELGAAVTKYIREKGGECMAMELGEIFGKNIPHISEFMRSYVPEAEAEGETRSRVYRLPEQAT